MDRYFYNWHIEKWIPCKKVMGVIEYNGKQYPIVVKRFLVDGRTYYAAVAIEGEYFPLK